MEAAGAFTLRLVVAVDVEAGRSMSAMRRCQINSKYAQSELSDDESELELEGGAVAILGGWPAFKTFHSFKISSRAGVVASVLFLRSTVSFAAFLRERAVLSCPRFTRNAWIRE